MLLPQPLLHIGKESLERDILDAEKSITINWNCNISASANAYDGNLFESYLRAFNAVLKML